MTDEQINKIVSAINDLTKSNKNLSSEVWSILLVLSVFVAFFIVKSLGRV